MSDDLTRHPIYQAESSPSNPTPLVADREAAEKLLRRYHAPAEVRSWGTRDREMIEAIALDRARARAETWEAAAREQEELASVYEKDAERPNIPEPARIRDLFRADLLRTSAARFRARRRQP